jgi:hypothetical protein
MNSDKNGYVCYDATTKQMYVMPFTDGDSVALQNNEPKTYVTQAVPGVHSIREIRPRGWFGWR